MKFLKLEQVLQSRDWSWEGAGLAVAGIEVGFWVGVKLGSHF